MNIEDSECRREGDEKAKALRGRHYAFCLRCNWMNLRVTTKAAVQTGCRHSECSCEIHQSGRIDLLMGVTEGSSRC